MQYYTKFMDFVSNLPQLFTSVFGQVWETIRCQVQLEGVIDLCMILVVGLILLIVSRKLYKYIKSKDYDEDIAWPCCIVLGIALAVYLMFFVSLFRPSLTKMLNPDYQTIIEIQRLCK